eukprot:603531_1
MGSTQSDDITTDIERKLHRSHWDSKYIHAYLLLGTQSSGKTTVFKQLQLIHFTDDFIDLYPNALYSIRQRCISTILTFCSTINDHDTDTVGSLQHLSRNLDHPDHLETIKSIIKNVYQMHTQRLMKLLPKTTLTYLEKIDQIMSVSYTITIDDIMADYSHTGLHEMCWFIKDNEFKVIDIGSYPCNITSYIHLFDNVHVVVYMLSLADFCSNTTTKNGVVINAMLHSLQHFTDIVQTKKLQNCEWVLFLSKADIFIEKLKEGFSLSECFGDKWHGPEFVNNKIPLIVSCMVRNIMCDQNLIPVDILRLVERYASIRYTIDGIDCDEDAYFEHCYEHALIFIQQQFTAVWSEVMFERPNQYLFCQVAPTIDTHTVEKVFWDMTGIAIRSNLKWHTLK